MTTSLKPAHFTPTSARGRNTSPSSNAVTNKASAVAVLALNMSWQLLVVVVAPVLAGDWADVHFDTAPWCTVAGLVISLIGMVVVVTLTLKEFNMYMQIETKEPK